MKFNIPYHIEFNGHPEDHFGVFLYDLPDLSLGAPSYETYAVAGRRGELVGKNDSVGNAKLKCTFSILSKCFLPDVLKIKSWLSGTGKLRTSDHPECYYNVLKITYGDIERDLRAYGRFTVTFICEPYLFRRDGDISVAKITYNPYDECRPVYKITGNGTCTLTVNGKSVSATIGQNLTIDTNRMLAFREDGTIMNTSLTGDYEDLWIPRGECSISVSSGYDLEMQPKWGYEL